MGQKREVTTVRFFVRETFEKVPPHLTLSLLTSIVLTRNEQRVLELQGLKKTLASLLSAPHDGSAAQSGLNMGSLDVGIPIISFRILLCANVDEHSRSSGPCSNGLHNKSGFL